MKTVIDAPIENGTRVLVRCDLDVLNDDGEVKDLLRLEACIETLRHIQAKGGVPIIAGHIGRPKGSVNSSLSTKVLRSFFEEMLSDEFELLENLRFDSGEEGNSEEFAKSLAQKADIYVNESFATSHRQAASITSITSYLPSYAGIHLEEEVKTVEKVLKNPKRPLVAIIGGSKIETKKPTIKQLSKVADVVLIGGKLALEEPYQAENVINPTDYNDYKDIGPKTIKAYKTAISDAHTVIWAGPMGLFEQSEYANGTIEIAKAISKNKDCFCLVGGGDTARALNMFGLTKNMGYVSTGGGALLDFIAQGNLPGLAVLGYKGLYGQETNS